ncbi:G-box-binding factor 3 isoform X2 [Nilaparvata lugens]|uniref:G-box-binding factor 3 isoform X2 n=1 Tax=Nilaparvata lugens TaxID=108931 RepID=UPI00193D9624|nr:G-box-binding factor 3 isoform X2 [Nilaparvata lugens]XP_039284663.1 G-box-binding factor 3 isoform X2 [Nilaparvata lugens]
MMYDDLAPYSQPPMALWADNGAWKMEPPSPPSPPPVPSSPFVDLDTDSWFQDGGAANVHNQHYTQYAACQSPDLIVPEPQVPGYDVTAGQSDVPVCDVTAGQPDKPATRAEAAQKLLNDLDEWIKEEPFSDWYEEKIDLPIFEELETVQPPPPAPLLQPTPLIARRCDVPAYPKMAVPTGVHLPYPTKMSSATPVYPKMAAPVYPKMVTPVYPTKMAATVALIGGQPQQQQHPSLIQEFDFVLSHHNHHQEQMLTPPESPTEVRQAETMLQDMPTEELDELVRIRVESLVEGGDDSCSSYSPEREGEECSMSSEGEGEGCGSHSPAPSSSMEDSGYDDPEWSPQTNAGCGPTASQSKRSRRQSDKKPYSRPPPEEKRQRKKEQNKNAATRYRLKKKAEIEEILGEERELMDKNQQLKTDVGELQREIKYLKSLMREMLRRKKVIK